jgi:TolB-like protein
MNWDAIQAVAELSATAGVRIAGGQVTLPAELRDAARDDHLWGEEFDREFSVDDIVSLSQEP